jgi:uncharacterized protein (DUF2141 family)
MRFGIHFWSILWIFKVQTEASWQKIQTYDHSEFFRYSTHSVSSTEKLTVKLHTIWRSFPPSMKIFFLVYFLLPILSSFESTNLWQIASQVSAQDIVTAGIAYFIAPWLICALLFKRSALVLPALIVQLGAMAVDAMTHPSLDRDFLYFRVAAILVVCIAGVIFTSRDILFPLMTTNNRGFRRAPRIYANRPLKLFDHGQPIPVVLENCSLTGLALFGEYQQISNFLRSRYFDDPIFVALGREDDSPIVRASLVAIRNDQTHIRLGLSIAESRTMSKFIRSLHNHRSDVATKFKLAWNSSYFQRIAIGIWAVTMFSLIVVPTRGHVKAGTAEDSIAMLSSRDPSGPTGELLVEVAGFTTDSGVLRLVLDNSPENFLKQGILTGDASIRDGKSVFVFKGVPFGEYAVRIFHDANENGQLDANLFGIPTEAYGFSNNARRKFGAPSFEESKFKFEADKLQISIQVSTHL